MRMDFRESKVFQFDNTRFFLISGIEFLLSE